MIVSWKYHGKRLNDRNQARSPPILLVECTVFLLYSKNDAIECEQQLLISVLKDIPDAAGEQMKQFAELWHEIGVKESNRESRRKQMKDHIMSLLGEMLEEEQNVKGQIENDIRLYREDLEKLSVQLKEDFTLVRDDDKMYVCEPNCKDMK